MCGMYAHGASVHVSVWARVRWRDGGSVDSTRVPGEDGRTGDERPSGTSGQSGVADSRAIRGDDGEVGEQGHP